MSREETCSKRSRIIREGIEGILSVLYNFHLDGDAYAEQIIEYLHSQVEGELPDIEGIDISGLGIKAAMRYVQSLDRESIKNLFEPN